MPAPPTEAPEDKFQAAPARSKTLAAVEATRRAAAGRAQRAYAMLDAARAAEQEIQRLLRLAKDREPCPDGKHVDDPQDGSDTGHGRAHPATPDRALCAARTKPLRVSAGGNDPLR